MEILISLVVGFGLGCMFYRYYAQRDPAKLEAWAAAIRKKTQNNG